MFSLFKQLKSSEGYKLSQKIRRFSLTTYTFNQNYIELSKNLREQQEPHNAYRLMHKEHRDELELIQLETVRMLHNFIASAFSLVDHTRVFCRDLYKEPHPFMSEYQTMVDSTFKVNPLAMFVKDFRQYVQHFQSPAIAIVSNLTDNPSDINARVVIAKDILLQFSGWNAPAKIYIEQIGKELDVQTMAEDYYSLVLGFYNWFQKRQQEVHKVEFEELEFLDKEIITAKLSELIFQMISSDTYNKETFKKEIRGYMGAIEKEHFDSITPQQQIDFIISALQFRGISFTAEEETSIRIKYCL